MAGRQPGWQLGGQAPKCSVQQLRLPASDKHLAWLQYPRPSLYKINSPEVHTKETARGRKREKGNRESEREKSRVRAGSGGSDECGK